jgi:hypothetical protein
MAALTLEANLAGSRRDVSEMPIADTRQLVASLLARYNFLQNHFDMTSAQLKIRELQGVQS